MWMYMVASLVYLKQSCVGSLPMGIVEQAITWGEQNPLPIDIASVWFHCYHEMRME